MTENPLLTRTRKRLQQLDARARKRLGQHFLIDGGVLELILTSARLSPADTVIEVGPGLGVLTEELARRAGRVIAIELDDKLAAAVKDTLAGYPNVTVINDDILKIAPAALVEDKGTYKVVANLPYYITAPVLRHFLEASVKPEMMVVMVQKEVAETIAAKPGDCSLLSVAVQFYGKPEIAGIVPAGAFYPAPKVDSAILHIQVYPNPPVSVNEKEFFGVVKAGFSARRKQIANSLANGLGLPKADALELLQSAGISQQRRAETLSIEEWAGLMRAFGSKGKP